MPGFTEVFGGNNVSPSQLSFNSLTIAADTQLSWPIEASSTGPYVAQKMNVTASSAGLSLTMPDASQVSPGQDSLIVNVGTNTFTVKSYGGATIGTVAQGQAWFFYVTDNTTQAGSWSVTQQGAGSSSAQAASIAGLGTAAAASLLNVAFPTSSKNSAYTIGANDRASLVECTDGTTTFGFVSAVTLGSNWFCFIRNDGTGALTLDPSGSELIDNASTKVLQIGESCMVFSNGTGFNTVGYGRSVVTTVTAINIARTTSPQTLSASETAAQIQNFTGTLAANHVFEYGTVPGFWFVTNSLTLSGFSATWRVDSSDAGVTSASIAAGTRAILVSNGTNIVLAVSLTSGTVTSVASGTGLTGGPITTSGTLSLANTAVTPGSYRMTNATVDAQGRLTAATNASPATTVVNNIAAWGDVTGTSIVDSNVALSDVDRLSLAQTMTAAKRGAVTALTDAATITPDFAVSNNFAVTLGGNRTMANPTNVVAGQSGVFRIVQDATGSRTLAFGANWKFPSGTAPTLSAAPNAVDLLVYFTDTSSTVSAVLLNGLA